jgi:hypothetical protein
MRNSASSTGDGHLADDVVSLRLIGAVDDAPLPLEGEHGRSGRRSVRAIRLERGAVELFEGLLNLADVVASGSGDDVRGAGNGGGFELRITAKELRLGGHRGPPVAVETFGPSPVR